MAGNTKILRFSYYAYRLLSNVLNDSKEKQEES